jgi:hypothetical protein
MVVSDSAAALRVKRRNTVRQDRVRAPQKSPGRRRATFKTPFIDPGCLGFQVVNVAVGHKDASSSGVWSVGAKRTNMPDRTENTPTSSPHIEDTVQAIAALHAEHYQQATPLQGILGRMTATLGCPAFSVILAIALLAWVSVNLAILWAGGAPWDPPRSPT